MAYDKAQPAPGIKAKELDNLIRTNNDSIQPAIDNEHEFTNASASQSGDHVQGSARCFYTDTAPPTRIDGGLFKTTDLGSLWIDTDDNALYILTAITPTWTAISTEVIELLLASPRTFLDTLDVTGVLTALAAAVVTTTLTVGTSLDIASTVAVVGTIDDDTMGTATDTTIATSESIKAYADTKEAILVTQTAASIFGARTSADTDTATLVKTTIYRAECDGYLTVMISGVNDWTKIFSNSSSSPSVKIGHESASSTGGGDGKASCMTVPIRKLDYVKVTTESTGTPTIYWVPIGTGGLEK